jgi:hypothetical protein
MGRNFNSINRFGNMLIFLIFVLSVKESVLRLLNQNDDFFLQKVSARLIQCLLLCSVMGRKMWKCFLPIGSVSKRLVIAKLMVSIILRKLTPQGFVPILLLLSISNCFAYVVYSIPLINNRRKVCIYVAIVRRIYFSFKRSKDP